MNVAGIYDEMKMLSFAESYLLCHPLSREGDLLSWTAVVVPPFGEAVPFDIFWNDQKVAYTPDRAEDGHQYVAKRLNMLGGGVRRVRFSTRLSDDQTGQIICRERNAGNRIGCPYFVPGNSYRNEGTQASTHMLRAARSDDELYHLISGFDDFQKLMDIFKKQINRERPLRILDWGVGSARVARHMLRHEQIQLYGADIDPVNMGALHNSGFSRDRFRLMDPGGEIPFGPETFDTVYGISVFTHLTEALQFKYLEDLKRVLAPDGMGIFSIHGFIHFFSRINDGETFLKWMERGFLTTGRNRDLRENFSDSRDLYVDSLHTPNYIYKNWSRVFSRIRILRAPNAYGHDLVICQK